MTRSLSSRNALEPPLSSSASELDKVASVAAARTTRWRPGLAADGRGVLHGEVFGGTRDAAACSAALAFAIDDWLSHRANPGLGEEREDRRSILWVQTKGAARLTGLPYRPGLPPVLSARIIHVLARTCEDALFALEEGLRCRDLAFVIGEVEGNPRAMDFTASRRLSLAAERHGIALWLVRLDGQRDLSSARMRWQVRADVSPPPRWNAQAPGAATWRAELFRSRTYAPGEWLLVEEGCRLNAHKLVSQDAEASLSPVLAPERSA